MSFNVSRKRSFSSFSFAITPSRVGVAPLEPAGLQVVPKPRKTARNAEHTNAPRPDGFVSLTVPDLAGTLRRFGYVRCRISPKGQRTEDSQRAESILETPSGLRGTAELEIPVYKVASSRSSAIQNITFP